MVNKLLALCLIALATPSMAAVYQWTDDQGVTHFSSSPQSRDAKPVDIAPAPPPDPQLEQRAEKSKERDKLYQEKQQLEAEEQSQQAQLDKLKEKRKELCEDYANNLKLLQDVGPAGGRRLYTVDAQGEYHYLSDEERQEQIATTQKNQEKYCKDTQ